MDKKQMKTIIGGIFGTGTYTVWDEEGQAHIKKEKFNIRLYKDLWHSGAIKKLKGNLLGIFLTIAIHADGQGEGWPTQQTIANLLGINRDTVGKGLQKLEEYGFIEREKTRHQGKFDNTVYKIKFAPDLKDESEDHGSVNKRKKSERPQKYHDEKSVMVKKPENQHFHHAGKTDTEKPTRKNRHGKTDYKDYLFLQDDPLLKNDPSSSNHHQDKPEEKQVHQNQKLKKKYDDDIEYVTFRNLFIASDGQDINRHDLHHPKFKSLIEDHGFSKVIEWANRYISSGYHDEPQIVYFLSEGWKNYREGKKKEEAALVTKKAKKAIEALTATTEEADPERKERIAKKLSQWESRKNKSFITHRRHGTKPFGTF